MPGVAGTGLQGGVMLEQLVDIVRAGIGQALANVHTVTIARVTRVGETAIDCQPVIARLVNGQPVELPEFVDVPPVFLHGGASYLAHPIAVGDYALLLICERCFDRWYAGQDGLPPAQARMHDYSDGFALVGVRVAAGAIPIPDQTTMTGITRMGVTDPGDHMALAAKVLAELEKIKAQLDAMVTAYNGHTHGSTPGPSAPMPPPPAPAPVASAYVEAE